jgi:hypothetical protein
LCAIVFDRATAGVASFKPIQLTVICFAWARSFASFGPGRPKELHPPRLALSKRLRLRVSGRRWWWPTMPRDMAKFSLRVSPYEAILRLARAFALQAAREDRERNVVRKKGGSDKESSGLCSILNRSSE